MRRSTLFLLLIASMLLAWGRAASSESGDVSTDARKAEIARCVHDLGSRYFSERAAARDRLEAIGVEAAPSVIALLTEPRSVIRIAAAEILGAVKSAEAAGPLAALVGDPDPLVDRAAVLALARIGLPAQAALRDARGRDPVRLEAIDAAIGYVEQWQVETHLSGCITKQMGYGNFKGQFDALKGMSPRPLAPLLRLFTDPAYEFTDAVEPGLREEIVRMLAGDALGDMEDPSVIEPLRLVAEGRCPIPSGQPDAWRDSARTALYKLGEKTYLEGERKAIEANPPERRGPPEWERLGTVCMKMGDYPAALPAMERHLAMTPPEMIPPVEYYNLACLYSIAGRKSEAVTMLKQSSERGYQDWDWIERDGDLGNLREEPGYQALLQAGREQEGRERTEFPEEEDPP